MLNVRSGQVWWWWIEASATAQHAHMELDAGAACTDTQHSSKLARSCNNETLLACTDIGQPEGSHLGPCIRGWFRLQDGTHIVRE